MNQTVKDTLGDIGVGLFLVTIVIALLATILGILVTASTGHWVICGILTAALLLFTAWQLGRSTR